MSGFCHSTHHHVLPQKLLDYFVPLTTFSYMDQVCFKTNFWVIFRLPKTQRSIQWTKISQFPGLGWWTKPRVVVPQASRWASRRALRFISLRAICLQTSMESNKDVPLSNRTDAGHLIMMYIHRNMNIHMNYETLIWIGIFIWTMKHEIFIWIKM